MNLGHSKCDLQKAVAAAYPVTFWLNAALWRILRTDERTRRTHCGASDPSRPEKRRTHWRQRIYLSVNARVRLGSCWPSDLTNRKFRWPDSNPQKKRTRIVKRRKTAISTLTVMSACPAGEKQQNTWFSKQRQVDPQPERTQRGDHGEMKECATSTDK